MADTVRPDTAAAAEKATLLTIGKRQLRALDARLADDEQVKHLAAGKHGSAFGLLAVTDRRVLFVKDGWMSKAFVDLPLSAVTHVGFDGTRIGTLTVGTLGVAESWEGVRADDAQPMMAAIRMGSSQR